MFDLAQYIAIVGSLLGAITAGVLSVLPRVIFQLRSRASEHTPLLRTSFSRTLGYLFLGLLFGFFVGFITGFIGGGYLSRNNPSMLYGPLIGALYGAMGGIIGGVMGSVIPIPK